MSTTREDWLDEPAPDRPRRTPFVFMRNNRIGAATLHRHFWYSDPALSEYSSDEQRIANLSKDFRRISPEASAPGKCCNGSGVILEVGQVDDGVALDVSSGLHYSRSTERHSQISLKCQAAYGWMLITIAKRVDRRDREPRTCGRRGGRTDRHSGDENPRHS